MGVLRFAQDDRAYDLKFVGAVRTEDEFELQENRIDVATGQEKGFVEKVVIVLQPDFRELGRVPGEVRADL